LKKLIAVLSLCTFIFSSTFVSTAFAADEGPARPTPGTAEKSQHEITTEQPAAVESEEAVPAEAESQSAEDIANSEATKAFVSGRKIKYIEGAIFVTALIVMAVAVSGSDSGH
jgi:hypothetical protein